jgi:hypothetical protein
MKDDAKTSNEKSSNEKSPLLSKLELSVPSDSQRRIPRRGQL